MRIIVGCEYSQAVTKAFRAKGHEAFSCDILPCEGGHPEWHFQESILTVLDRECFDMGIFHPPCTYISYAATQYWNRPGRARKRLEALDFFLRCLEAPIEKICVENPLGCADAIIRKHDQIIHPYYFGDNDLKRTCLWLKNLPKLVHVKQSNLFEQATHAPKPEPYYVQENGKKIYFSDSVGGGKNQGHIRSKTFPGIAAAMADQWG